MFRKFLPIAVAMAAIGMTGAARAQTSVTLYGIADGGRVRVVSRRGSIEAPAAYDDTLRPGLAFMNLHFPELVDTNILTIDATDPKSGTAEFKATAIRIEKLEAVAR